MKFNGFVCDRCGKNFKGRGKNVIINGEDFDYCKVCVVAIKTKPEVIEPVTAYIPIIPWYPEPWRAMRRRWDDYTPVWEYDTGTSVWCESDRSVYNTNTSGLTINAGADHPKASLTCEVVNG